MKKQIVVHQFYCPAHDWALRPFRVTKSELKDAGGWIACETCGEPCKQVDDIKINVWRK